MSELWINAEVLAKLLDEIIGIESLLVENNLEDNSIRVVVRPREVEDNIAGQTIFVYGESLIDIAARVINTATGTEFVLGRVRDV